MLRRTRFTIRLISVVVVCFCLIAVSLTENGVFDRFFGATEVALGATCPFADGDGGDSDGGGNGTYTFTTGNHNVVGAATAYDCTSGATGITTFTVPSGATVTFAGDTSNGYITDFLFTNLTVNSGGILNANTRGCVDSLSDTGGGAYSYGGPGWGPDGSNICVFMGQGYGDGDLGGSAGGSHGGVAGRGSDHYASTYYDDPLDPVLFGASAGSSYTVAAGGTGGGVIKMTISGTFTHNGTVTANGGNGTYTPSSIYRGSGGGSGGSINITAGTLAGSTGTFSAYGGTGAASGGTTGGNDDDGGGGGGGRIALFFGSSSFSLDSTDFDVHGGVALDNTQNADDGQAGTVYVRETTNNDIWIYHGFTWEDIDYTARDFTVDTSATNQYCDAVMDTASTPSVTASRDMTLGGTFNCADSVATWDFSAGNDFAISASTNWTLRGAVTMAGTNSFAIGNGTNLTQARGGGFDLDFTIPAGDNQTWTDVDINVANRGYFTISDAIGITLAGDSDIYANAQWTALTSLNVSTTTASIDASSRGCVDSTTDTGGGAWSYGGPGWGPDGTNTCIFEGQGYGKGDLGGSGGGSYGGVGGRGSDHLATTYFGDATDPVFFGASAGTSYNTAGGTGGGYVKLVVSGTLTNEGLIAANGGNGSYLPSALYRGSGGGAGGSVNITTGTLAGTTGTFKAAGGTGAASGGVVGGNADDGGGGGGGRVKIQYTTSTFSHDASDFDVNGGVANDTTQSAVSGSSGTVYVKDATNNDVYIYAGFTYDDTDWVVHDWTSDTAADNQFCDTAAVTPSITATGSLTLGGTVSCSGVTSFDFTGDTVALSGGLTYTSTDPLNITATSAFSIGSNVAITLTGGTDDFNLNIPAGTYTFDNVDVTLQNRGEFIIDDALDLTLTNDSDILSNVDWTNFTDLSISSDSSINADEKGCPYNGTNAGDGYGPDGSNICTVTTSGYGDGDGLSGNGASHAGIGGKASNGSPVTNYTSYGDPAAPTFYGSSGGNAANYKGGRGGGRVRIDVSGTFTANGPVSANAAGGEVSGSYGAGGGSGGSIYITAGTFAGTTGTFSANGGDGGASSGWRGGGGGAGRIAIVYSTATFSHDASDFSATGGAAGGGSAVAGGTGSVFVKDTTNNDVTIYEGFTFGDIDYSVHDWTVDAGADGMKCESYVAGSATPSVTTSGAISWDGVLVCGENITSFALAGGTDLDMNGGTIDISSGGSLDMTLPTSGTATWNDATITIPIEKDFTINDAANIALTGTTTITANVQWTGLASLSTASGTTISATARGCRNSTSSSSDGYGPDGSNVCTITTAGYGWGDGLSSGGAAYGGTGGRASNGFNAVTTNTRTYGSDTAPTFYGSSGGTAGTTAGGRGGGLIRISVTGTLTHNGAFTANAGNGIGNGSYGSGGGAGGSIYITTNVMAGSTGSVSATGGTGGNGSSWDGGGGGGGRIRIEYESDTTSGSLALDDGADTVGGSDNTVLTAGGVALGGGLAADGGDGTVSIANLNPPPTVTVVSHTPDPAYTDSAITLNATATDSGGVTQIDIYLGTAIPGNLKKTCTYGPSQTTANCSAYLGQLPAGDYTTTVVASDGSQIDQSTENWSVLGYTTANYASIARNAVGATGVDFDLSFTFATATSGTMTVTFQPNGGHNFTVNQEFQSGSCSGGGTISATGYTSTSITLTKSSCVGMVSLSDALVTNPSSPGLYTITWDDPGSIIVAIVDSDQVSVSGTVTPTITFVIGVQAAASTCDNSFAGSGGTLGLGTLTTGSVTSSDASGIPHICSKLSHNGTGGAVVSVKSLYGQMQSTAVPADTIVSNDVTLTAGTEGYGMCIGSAGGDTGVDVTDPVGSSPVRTAPFNGTCDSTTHNIGGLTGATQTLWTLAGPAQNAFARIYLKAGISPLTEAHDDYTDTLTFIATATY